METHTLEEYDAYISERCSEIQEDLWRTIWDAIRHDPNFKGATIGNGEAVIRFKDGIGIKVEISLDHRPLKTRKES